MSIRKLKKFKYIKQHWKDVTSYTKCHIYIEEIIKVKIVN